MELVCDPNETTPGTSTSTLWMLQNKILYINGARRYGNCVITKIINYLENATRIRPMYQASQWRPLVVPWCISCASSRT